MPLNMSLCFSCLDDLETHIQQLLKRNANPSMRDCLNKFPDSDNAYNEAVENASSVIASYFHSEIEDIVEKFVFSNNTENWETSLAKSIEAIREERQEELDLEEEERREREGRGIDSSEC